MELSDIVNGLQLKQSLFFEEMMVMLSQHGAWVMSPHTKRKVKPTDLFDAEKFRKKWDQMRRKERLTMEQRKEMVRQARERARERGVNNGQ